MGIVRLDRCLDRLQIHRTVSALLQRLWLDRAEDCHAARFPAIGMRRLADDGFFAARTMRHETEQIGLCSTDAIKCRLKAKHARGVFLESIDGRVLAVDVITDRRVKHRLAHGAGRAGDGVAAEIDGRVHVRGHKKYRGSG